MTAVCAGFEQFVQQYGNSYISVTRRGHASAVPVGQQEMSSSADRFEGIPYAYGHARTENDRNRLPFGRNEDLAGVEKMGAWRRWIQDFAGQLRVASSWPQFQRKLRTHGATCFPCSL